MDTPSNNSVNVNHADNSNYSEKEDSNYVKKLLCIGGGSGGHILPIVILHESVKSVPGLKVVWIGESNSMDENKAREHSIEFFGVPAVKFRRHISLGFFMQPWYFLSSFILAWRLVSKIQPDAVFCKGGGVALTVGLVIKLKNIPLFTHESDTVPGMTNTLLGKWSKCVYLGFSEASKYFGNAPCKTVGQWVDPIFLEYAKNNPFSPVATAEITKKTRVVVQCGGLGSTKIFTELLSLLDDFRDMEFTVALGTKNEHFYDDFKSFPHVHVKKWFYHEELAEAYASSDIGIVRAAANTLAECDMFGVKMIMIPLGIASFDHQTTNAIAFEKKSQGYHQLLSESHLGNLGKMLAALRGFKKSSYGSVSDGALTVVRADILAELAITTDTTKALQ